MAGLLSELIEQTINQGRRVQRQQQPFFIIDPPPGLPGEKIVQGERIFDDALPPPASTPPTVPPSGGMSNGKKALAGVGGVGGGALVIDQFAGDDNEEGTPGTVTQPMIDELNKQAESFAKNDYDDNEGKADFNETLKKGMAEDDPDGFFDRLFDEFDMSTLATVMFAAASGGMGLAPALAAGLLAGKDQKRVEREGKIQNDFIEREIAAKESNAEATMMNAFANQASSLGNASQLKTPTGNEVQAVADYISNNFEVDFPDKDRRKPVHRQLLNLLAKQIQSERILAKNSGRQFSPAEEQNVVTRYFQNNPEILTSAWWSGNKVDADTAIGLLTNSNPPPVTINESEARKRLEELRRQAKNNKG